MPLPCGCVLMSLPDLYGPDAAADTEVCSSLPQAVFTRSVPLLLALGLALLENCNRCAGTDCAAGDSMAGRASTASIPVVVVSEGGTDTALAALEAAGGDIRAARLGNSFLSWSC